MSKDLLTEENFVNMTFCWRDRQAGVGIVYDPDSETYQYNAYCIDKKLVKEIFSCEYEFLEDALTLVNQEYGNWELVDFDQKGCGSCAAKK